MRQSLNLNSSPVSVCNIGLKCLNNDEQTPVLAQSAEVQNCLSLQALKKRKKERKKKKELQIVIKCLQDMKGSKHGCVSSEKDFNVQFGYKNVNRS